VPGTVSIGNAEDVAEVVSIGYGYGQDPELDQLVPQALAEQYCPNDDCVVTRDFSPLDPEADERKYYAPGVGVFLEVNRTEQAINQLVGCNVDAKCSALP